MQSRQIAKLMLGLASLVFVIPLAGANPVEGHAMLGEALKHFTDLPLQESVLHAAKKLFWSLATISLVWTLGMLIVRQDIGEMLMELLRFIVVTGTFYWLLINASASEGGGAFVRDIVESFFQMSNGDPTSKPIVTTADGVLARGLNVYFSVMKETDGGKVEDVLIAGGMAIMILVLCALMAAQFLMALTMAWMLSYAGIFLLGFGGARWTSSIAISFYKHVLAIGVALLALHFVGAATTGFLALYDDTVVNQHQRTVSEFDYLGSLLAAVVLMLVLSIKLPQLLYTLVTGSPLGVFTGMATMAGHAFATGGGAAWASAASALPQGGGGWNGGGDSASARSSRTDSVMDAVQRSTSAATGVGDSFHIGAGQIGPGSVSNLWPRVGSAFGAAQAGSVEGRGSSDFGKTRVSASAFGVSFDGGRATNEARNSGDSEASSVKVTLVTHQGTVERTAHAVTMQESPGDTPNAGSPFRPDYDAELSAIEASRQTIDMLYGYERPSSSASISGEYATVDGSGSSSHGVGSPGQLSNVETDCRLDVRAGEQGVSSMAVAEPSIAVEADHISSDPRTGDVTHQADPEDMSRVLGQGNAVLAVDIDNTVAADDESIGSAMSKVAQKDSDGSALPTQHAGGIDTTVYATPSPVPLPDEMLTEADERYDVAAAELQGTPGSGLDVPPVTIEDQHISSASQYRHNISLEGVDLSPAPSAVTTIAEAVASSRKELGAADIAAPSWKEEVAVTHITSIRVSEGDVPGDVPAARSIDDGTKGGDEAVPGSLGDTPPKVLE